MKKFNLKLKFCLNCDKTNVKDPPMNSCGCNFPSLALSASFLISSAISGSRFEAALKMIGVIKPVGAATAIEISTVVQGVT